MALEEIWGEGDGEKKKGGLNAEDERREIWGESVMGKGRGEDGERGRGRDLESGRVGE